MSMHDFVFILAVLFVALTLVVGVLMWLDVRWWRRLRQDQADRMFGTTPEDLNRRLELRHPSGTDKE